MWILDKQWKFFSISVYVSSVALYFNWQPSLLSPIHICYTKSFGTKSQGPGNNLSLEELTRLSCASVLSNCLVSGSFSTLENY